MSRRTKNNQQREVINIDEDYSKTRHEIEENQ